MPSKTRYKVEVTERDIERAKISDSYRCVVVQAVARNIPDATRIEADTQSVRFTREGERYIYLTPYAVQGYVIAFDAGEPIEPFTFTLNRPQIVARRLRTEAGKAAAKEAKRARTAVETVSRPPRSRKKSEPPKTSSDTRIAYAEAKTETVGGTRAAPRRVFKSKSRSYGHRLLRINQD